MDDSIVSISELIQHLQQVRTLMGEVPVRYSPDGKGDPLPIYTVADYGQEMVVLLGVTMAELMEAEDEPQG